MISDMIMDVIVTPQGVTNLGLYFVRTDTTDGITELHDKQKLTPILRLFILSGRECASPTHLHFAR